MAEAPIDSVSRDSRQVISLLRIAAKGAALAEVVSNTGDAKLGFRKPLGVAGKEALDVAIIDRQRFQQFSNAGAQSIDFAGLCHPVHQLDHCGFNMWQASPDVIHADAFRLESFAINCQIGLAGEFNFSDPPARPEDVHQDLAHRAAIFGTSDGLDQSTVNVEENYTGNSGQLPVVSGQLGGICIGGIQTIARRSFLIHLS